jgi:hypothetical protein
MKTAADVVTTISAIYYQVNLFEDKQLTGYMNHFAWPEWGGHKQMIQGAKAEMLEWIRRYLEPQERGEAFDHFEFSYHPYYPGIGVEVHRDTGTPNTSVLLRFFRVSSRSGRVSRYPGFQGTSPSAGIETPGQYLGEDGQHLARDLPRMRRNL